MAITYKPILPSGLVGPRKESNVSFSKKILNDNSLKVGVVLDVLEPKDDRKTPEYRVLCIEQDKDQGRNTTIYKNCLALDSFGGIADFFQFRRRTSDTPKKVETSGSLKNQNGSIVLLLCLDNSSDQGIIIGALSHPDKDTILTEENGHHMEAEFNGLNVVVDKDGALTITYRSATDNDGKPGDEEAGGTHLQIDKTGSMDFNTNLEGEDQTFVNINKPDKNVDVKAGNNIALTAVKDIEATAKANIKLTATTDIIAKAEGNAVIESMANLTLKASTLASLEAQVVNIKAAGQISVRSNLILIEGPTVSVGQAPFPALIFATQFFGVGNLGAPVISVAIGPFSSSVLIGA